MRTKNKRNCIVTLVILIVLTLFVVVTPLVTYALPFQPQNETSYHDINNTTVLNSSDVNSDYDLLSASYEFTKGGFFFTG